MNVFRECFLGETLFEKRLVPQPPFLKTFMRCFASMVLLSSAITAYASEVDRLARDLAGNDEAKRVEARQLLPREGIAAAAPLVDLLSHDNQIVWRTAQKVVRDIAHGGPVGVTKHERRYLSQLLLDKMNAGDAPVKRRCMELLTYAAPEDFDLDGFEKLLHDPDLRMDARGALELIATTEAVEILANAPVDDTQFAVAVIDSLSAIDSKKAASALKKHAKDSRIPVRLAALRGLIAHDPIAWADDCANALADAEDREDASLVHDAFDVYIRCADAIASKGGNWPHAIAMYKKVLAETDFMVWRGAALSGLGRHGDSEAVATIFTATRKYGVDLEPQALMALGDMKGRETYKAMLAEFDGASPTMKYGLLPLFGRTGDGIFLEILLAHAQGDDENLRAAAVEGLMQGVYAEGAEVASAYAESTEGEPRRYALRAIKLYAEALSAKNAGAAAGRAFVAVHRMAETDADRDIALAGIRRHPTAEGLNVIMADIDMGALDTLAVDTLISLAEALHGAEKVEDRDKVLDAIVANMKTTAELQAVAERIAGQEAFSPLSNRMGFVRKWHIVGPFSWDEQSAFEKNPIGAPDIDLSASYGDLKWKAIETGHPWAMVNLMGDIGAVEHSTAFAYATFKVTEATDGHIRAGSDDGLRIWLNGKLVHTNNVDRGAVLDSDIVPVKFKQGKNEMVVEISQMLGGWGYTVRLTGADNAPLPFSQE